MMDAATTSDEQEMSKVVAEQLKALKDTKKQEAGHKGAAVRQRKMEALKAEMVAAKEARFL